jgi:hypothetical protein
MVRSCRTCPVLVRRAPPVRRSPLTLLSRCRYVSYKASQICPEDLPCDGGYDFATRTDRPFVCGVRKAGDKIVSCGPDKAMVDFSQSLKFIISLSVALLAACII